MFSDAKVILSRTLEEIEAAGLTKRERRLSSPQGAKIVTATGDEVLNFCANNYLGLCDHQEVKQAAKEAMDRWGFGLSSVRFICGTQEIHKVLEAEISRYLGTEDTVLYSSCFDANGGLFETLLEENDAIISDVLNHASIIDGIRLSKAQRYRYKNGDLDDLEAQLKAAQHARLRLVATDGVFSMDGFVAKLQGICDLAEKYRAMVMVDDSHATGFMGPTGRGTPELCGVKERVDVITSTLGKALGGASGGFTTGKKEIIALLRQRSRPYLFSNTLPPPICGASLKVLEILDRSAEARERLFSNTRRFRTAMHAAGFAIAPGEHPITPVLIGEAKAATDLADALLLEGIYVIGFSFPVVPKGAARIRVQISAAHSATDIDRAVQAFTKVGRQRGLIP